MKHLLTTLSGDHIWIPCESVETESDLALFGDEKDYQLGNQVPKRLSKHEGDRLSIETVVSEDGAHVVITRGEDPQGRSSDASKDSIIVADGDVSLLLVKDEAMALDKNGTRDQSALKKADETQQVEGLAQSIDNGSGEGQEAQEAPLEGAMDVEGVVQREEKTGSQVQALDAHEGFPEVGEDDQDLLAPTRMRTRAQAQAASDNATTRTRSATPDSNIEASIHPYFLAPLKSHRDRDRDLGLPQHEAEETRKYLQLFIQKQEEVCRGVQKVFDGLLRADRYRHLVMKWAKAEAHVGLNRDMSDGEDWYDKEEWGLDEDLKKGQDEDEEDATTTSKKTRNTRRAN